MEKAGTDMADAQGLVDYIAAGPSPFHCVSETVRRLQEAGFTEWDRAGKPPTLSVGDGGYLREGGTVIAWRIGSESPAKAGFRRHQRQPFSQARKGRDSIGSRLKYRPSSSANW